MKTFQVKFNTPRDPHPQLTEVRADTYLKAKDLVQLQYGKVHFWHVREIHPSTNKKEYSNGGSSDSGLGRLLFILLAVAILLVPFIPIIPFFAFPIHYVYNEIESYGFHIAVPISASFIMFFLLLFAFWAIFRFTPKILLLALGFTLYAYAGFLLNDFRLHMDRNWAAVLCIGAGALGVAVFIWLRRVAHAYRQPSNADIHDEEIEEEIYYDDDDDEMEDDEFYDEEIDDDVDEWHQVLHVERNSSPDEIKKSYRELMKFYHTDRVNGLDDKIKKIAEEQTKKINAAYAEAKNAIGFK